MNATMMKAEVIAAAAALSASRAPDAPQSKDELAAVGALTAILRAELTKNTGNIPDDLKRIKGWVCWRTTNIAPTGKLNKIPSYPGGGNRAGEQGSERDLDRLGTWDEALAAFHQDKQLAGVGLAMLPQWGLVALDGDHCVEGGKIRPDAEQATDRTYCDISPSDSGIRAFWKGACTNGNNKELGFELYGDKQFVTVTGNVVQNAWTGILGSTAAEPLPELDAELRAELERLSTPSGRVSSSNSLTKAERFSAGAANDPKLQAIHAAGLYERDMSQGKHSITCPFEESHSDHPRATGDADTVYWQPQFNGYAVGTIHCSHTHSNDQRAYWAAIGYVDDDGFEAIAEETGVAATGLERNLVPLGPFSDFDFDEPMPHVVDMWIPQGEVTLLAGHGGGGKSYAALSLAVHVALGRPYGPLPTTQTNVLFFSGEDGARVLQQRLGRICRALNIDPAALNGKLHLLDASDIDPALHREGRAMVAGRLVAVTETALLAALSVLVVRLAAGLVVVDNASDAFDGDEVRRASVRAFVRSLRQRLARPGRAVLLLCHINKASANGGKNAGGEDYSGSTAWHNSSRSRLSLARDGDNALVITHAKANFGVMAHPVRLEWVSGVPLVAGTYFSLEADSAAESAKASAKAKNEADKRTLVGIIKDFDTRGERVTTSIQGSATVFKLLKGSLDFPHGTDSERLTRLLRELESEGEIFRRTVRTADRKIREVFTCSPLGETKSAPIPEGVT